MTAEPTEPRPADPNAPQPPGRRGRGLRWLAWLGLGLVLMALVAVAALPWVLSTGPARDWLVSRATAALAPGALEVQSFRWSWTGPTRMTGFGLRDHQGDRVVFAPRATWDRTLWQVLTDRPRLGTLTLENAEVDMERRADGTVDLTELLQPVVSPDPATSLRIRVVDGTLKLRAPNLAEPIEGRDFGLDVIRPVAPEPITIAFQLSGPAAPDGSGPATAQGQVTLDRWKPTPEAAQHPLEIALTSKAWPLALKFEDWTWRGRVGGSIAPKQADGRWSVQGDVLLSPFDLTGPALQGDALQFDNVTTGFDVAQTEAGWSIARLDLKSPSLTVQGSGDWPVTAGAARPTQVEGNVDLADLARRLPHALRLREGLTLDKGTAQITLKASEAAGASSLDVAARVHDLAATLDGKPLTIHAPATLGARLVGGPESLQLAQFDVATEFLQAQGSGDVDRGITIGGTLDLAALQRQAATLIDVGQFRAVGTGTFQAGYKRQGAAYDATLGLDLKGLDLNDLIRADAARIDGGLQGPADARGWPTGWAGGSLTARGGDLDTQVQVTSQAGRPAAIEASVRSPVKLGDGKGLADARLKARADDQGWAIDEAVLGANPPRAWFNDRLELALTGRYDPAAGTLNLTSLKPPADAAPLAVGPEGLRVSGLNDLDQLQARGSLRGDLASGARLLWAWTGQSPPLNDPAGRWTLTAEAQGAPGNAIAFGTRFDLPDPSWAAPDRDGDGQPDGRQAPGPIGLEARGAYQRGANRLDLAMLALASPYGQVQASGTIADPTGGRMADLRGFLDPNYAELTRLLAERIEPEARIAGQAQPFALRGSLAGPDPLRTLEAEAGLNLLDADILGLKLGATPLIARVSGGQVTIDPIRTSLNNGVIALTPELSRAESGGWILKLAPGSGVQDAEINDEVSDRVLSYAAPVLDNATKVNGRISAQLDRAEFPLDATLKAQTVVEGRVLFQDVEFTPGPLGQTLTSLTGKPPARIRLVEPVRLWIREGFIHTEGLVVPVGNLTRISINGDIGFDQQLALVASVPLLPTMLQGRPILEGFLGGQTIDVPIGGTIHAPQVDKQTFQAALDQLGDNLLMKSATTGAASILEKLSQPRDPLIPRMSPQERRFQRQQRRLDRRFGQP